MKPLFCYTYNRISKATYVENKASTDKKILELVAEVQKKEKQVAEILEENKQTNSTFLSHEKLTNELVKNLVKSIYIYDINRVEIEFLTSG